MAIGDLSSETHPYSAFSPSADCVSSRRSLGATLSEWRRRRDDRRELRRLLRIGPHMIADVGLTLDAARRDVEKPFWRP